MASRSASGGIGCGAASGSEDASSTSTSGSSSGRDGRAPLAQDGSSDGSGSGGAGAGGAGGGGDGGACVAKRALANRRGFNVLLLVDDSLSVVLQAVWGSLTMAISDFVDDPANTGVGVGIEYYGLSCNPEDYANPVVPIAPLPGNAASIKVYPLPISGKAIAPALRGAISYVRGVITATPERSTVLALVTDGVLDPLCGSTAASAASEGALGTDGAPPVKTYVIALSPGPTLINPGGTVDFAPLDGIARGGGTSKAVRVEVSAVTNTALTLALDSLVTDAAPCAYAIPKQIDASRAALEWRRQPGQPSERWPRVAGASACAGRAAVFPSDTPGFLELCPKACGTLRSSSASGTSGTAWAVEGCTSP